MKKINLLTLIFMGVLFFASSGAFAYSPALPIPVASGTSPLPSRGGISPAVPTPPLAPTLYRAEYHPMMGAVDLAWIDNSRNENGFVILREVTGSGSFETIDRVPANTTVHGDMPPLPRPPEETISYTYMVMAFNDYGFTLSNEVQVDVW